MPGGTKTEIFCFLPFSSSVKSSAFSPVTGWPFLSVTTTSTTTSRVLARMVMAGTSAGRLLGTQDAGRGQVENEGSKRVRSERASCAT